MLVGRDRELLCIAAQGCMKPYTARAGLKVGPYTATWL